MHTFRFDSRLSDFFNRRMDAVLEVLVREFSGIRAGRASACLLGPLKVDAYGAYMPIGQVATIGVPEARLSLFKCGIEGWLKLLRKRFEIQI